MSAVVRAECRECEWVGDYGDGTVAPSPATQMILHVVFSGHVAELVPAPEPDDNEAPEPECAQCGGVPSVDCHEVTHEDYHAPDMCCEPDYAYVGGVGRYVHGPGCKGLDHD